MKIKQRYVCIGGWLITSHEPKRIVLMRGNYHGEEIEKVLENLHPATTYKEAQEKSNRYAKDLGVRVGRAFNKREWLGEIEAVGNYVPD